MCVKVYVSYRYFTISTNEIPSFDPLISVLSNFFDLKLRCLKIKINSDTIQCIYVKSDVVIRTVSQVEYKRNIFLKELLPSSYK